MVAFVAGAVLTAANLNTSLNQLTIRTVTGTSDTLTLADQGGAVSYSNAASTTSTIPPNASVAFAVGTKIVLINLGAGVVTVTAGAGVTVNGATLTLAQNAGGTCIKTATNTWSFLPFSSGVGAANFSDTASGTYTGYKYIGYNASGTLTVTTAGFADVVLQGAGGAGGASGGGGGGAGERISQTIYLATGTYTITIGAGGAGSIALPTPPSGRSGKAASIIGVLSAPGGGGGGVSGGVGLDGANGGGASYGTGAGQSVTSFGFAGGTPGISANPLGSGCGGGSVSAVGSAAASSSVGGAGGAGLATTIFGTTPSGAYVAGNYLTGGGGGGGSTTTGGAGGTGGGGGGGANLTAGTAGTANTGGGGGGGGFNFSAGTSAGGNGGSAFIGIRVAV